jgi:NTE family protein
MDGGILDNFPVEPLEKECDVLIGSHANLLPTDPPGAAHIGKANILERCFHLAIAGSVYEKTQRCHLFIEPPLQRFNMFDAHEAEQIFAIGYQTARERIDNNHLFD